MLDFSALRLGAAGRGPGLQQQSQSDTNFVWIRAHQDDLDNAESRTEEVQLEDNKRCQTQDGLNVGQIE